jgi:hypothetical protein
MGLAGLEDRERFLRCIEHGRVGLLALDFLLEARNRLLKGLHVGEDQLGVDRLHVAVRVDLAVDVRDVAVGEAAHHLRDRVGLADVGEELIAEPLALTRAAHDSGDVDERHRRGKDLLRSEDLREAVQARIRKLDDADVRLDRCERVVRREDVVLGESVEQGRLAHVGKSYDADSQSHGSRFYPRRLARLSVVREKVDPWSFSGFSWC